MIGMDHALLIATLVFIVPMCFSPGPNNVLCAAHGSQHGFKGTLTLISGMAVGWSILGLFVGGATVFIEENKEFFDILTYIGAGYIAYLSFLGNLAKLEILFLFLESFALFLSTVEWLALI